MPEEAEGKTGRPTSGRNKPERPRDLLGRPQPWGSPNLLVMEDFDGLDRDENHRLAIEYFNSGRFFPAHEAWETAWKQSRDTGDAEFFKGLSQLGAGYVHLFRGNAHGAITLLRRAARRVESYADPYFGVQTGAVAERAKADASAVERGAITPGERAIENMPGI